MAEELEQTIEAVFAADDDSWQSPEARQAVRDAIDLLDRGELRIATREGPGAWTVNEWAKQAILLYFRQAEMTTVEIGPFEYFDKIPVKKGWEKLGVRVVPPATARYGAHIEAGAILMPSYVNIGAYVASGTLVDTWATVGSCAQIGHDVHLSGGVGIGGVLEPPSASPVIVEDGAFIGSRCVIVEGAVIEEEAVIGASTVITSSTPIIDVSGDEPVEHRGRVPRRSVVVPGTRAKKFSAGEYQLPCALIIGQRQESTDRKTSLNEALRSFGVQA